MVFICISQYMSASPKGTAAAGQPPLAADLKDSVRENHLKRWNGAPGSQTVWKEKWPEVRLCRNSWVVVKFWLAGEELERKKKKCHLGVKSELEKCERMWE